MVASTPTLASRGVATHLHDAVARLVELGGLAPTVAATERKEVIATVDRAIATLTSTRAALLLAERDAGTWKGSGDPSFESWWARTSHAGMRAATTEVRRADTLAAMPDLRAAVDAGHVSVEHLDVVARTGAGASLPVKRALASTEGQAEILALARRTDAGRFAKAAAMWSATIDRSGLERTHQAQRDARFLALADTPAGTRVSGLLDAVSGHRLRLALEAVVGKPAPDDDRSPEQRRADALDTMAEAILATPPTADGSTGRRPHVSLVMTPQTWSTLRAATLGDGTGPVDPSAPATLEDGTPVPDTELARVLCDCELTRVVLGAGSEPMDLGRAVRTHTPGQRRAITARDRGCLWPGCGAPARWCEVHHLVWWDRDGGETTVLDGALACSFHHHEIHRLDLAVTRFTIPPGGAPDGRSATYVITTPGGRVVADGRPGAPPGAGWRADCERAPGTPPGRPARTWLPGKGAVDGIPAPWRAQADAAATPSDPPPHLRDSVRSSPTGLRKSGSIDGLTQSCHDTGAGVSVGTGSLGSWTSS